MKITENENTTAYTYDLETQKTENDENLKGMEIYLNDKEISLSIDRKFYTLNFEMQDIPKLGNLFKNTINQLISKAEQQKRTDKDRQNQKIVERILNLNQAVKGMDWYPTDDFFNTIKEIIKDTTGKEIKDIRA